MMDTRKFVSCIACAAMLAIGMPSTAPAQGGAQPDAAAVTTDRWPKTAKAAAATYTLYQPQVESWDGHRLKARLAVSLVTASGQPPIFGVVEIDAVTDVDRQSRAVRVYGVKVREASFPSAAASAADFGAGLQGWLGRQGFTVSLDRMQAALAVDTAAMKTQAAAVANDPPRFIFAQSPVALVHVDGEPAWQPVGTDWRRVLNTRALILADASGKLYLHMMDGFLEASTLQGPWVVSRQVPQAAASLAQSLANAGVVDLMTGTADEATGRPPTLAAGAPQVMVATVPTELVLTEGPPEWTPIDRTSLLYVKNTSGNIFKDLNDQKTYLLVTGRWFRAADLSGPWQFVEPSALPAAFAAIPDDSPKENVKASIPGTHQAADAMISTLIPQTARVDRAKATFKPQVAANPMLKPIPGTSLAYVFNAPDPIIRVAQDEWYAVHDGVWFTATAPQGPWVVASSVPAAIYAIPPSAPVHYVTYLKVYEAYPRYVVVGYTPGYMGAMVTASGVVVYGTGYVYPSYIGTTVWYGAPVTYGYAANPTWTPWTGWVIGFGVGWAMAASSNRYCCYSVAPWWGPMPYAGVVRGSRGGVAVWGPGGWAATTGNVYHRWGPTTAVSRTSGGYNAWTGTGWSNKVGTSYNSVTGRVSAGQRASVSNVYTGNYAHGQRGATYNPTTGVAARGGSATVGNAYKGTQTSARYGQVSGPGGKSAGAVKVGNNVYAGSDGNVYRNTGDGWEKHDGKGGWNDAQRPPPRPTPRPAAATAGEQDRGQQDVHQSLDAQQRGRVAGDQRSAGAAWGNDGWGGGFEGGGARSREGVAEGGGSWNGGHFGGRGEGRRRR